jgi:riboflavin synthase
MFTGIIEGMGSIESLARSGDGGRLVVRAAEWLAALPISGSVAVNGCCLTVVEKTDATFAADLSGETLRRTSFGEMQPGAHVNLEKPLSAGAQLGGHFVQGHVDGVGRVAHLKPEGSAAHPTAWWLGVRVPEPLERYMAMKGSLALDGISLTIAGWHDGIVETAIIPYTFQHTNIGRMALGDPVNIEADMLAKYVERLLEAQSSITPLRVTLERLKEEGF